MSGKLRPLSQPFPSKEKGVKKNLLITGDSRGIGKAISDNFSRSLNVIGVSRTGNTIKCDLSKKEEIDCIIDYLKENNLKLDHVVINAGIGHFGEFHKGEIGKYEEIINLNLLSPIIMLRKLENHLNEKAKIIFIGSIISKKFMKYGAVYQASKFGLRGFAGALKNELKGKKIHIINPSIVDTSFHDESEIEISRMYKKTEIKDILDIVDSIISGKETRFEIDL